jgi:two-component system, NarL family, response regulator DevR
MSACAPIRVVLIDDHEIVRSGLSALLGREPDIHVLGSVADAEEGLALINAVEPDVAVVDYSLPRMSGVELCEKVAARHPNTAVVILTGFTSDQVVFSALEAGAKGYVCKDVDGAELRRSIRSVARGETAFDPKVTTRVLRWAHRRSAGYVDNSLSVREIETLRLVARGATNRGIAESMHVSENTVKTYVRRALEKLDCHSRSEAAVQAARRGLL